MGLLLNAAIAWNRLQNTTYDIFVGRKKRWSQLFSLNFCPEDFPHMAGMQYARDVDFGINPSEIRGHKFLAKLLNHEIDDTKIEKAATWETRIRGRLEGIIALEETLDTDFLIYQFDPKHVPHGSDIDAKFVIKNMHSGATFFVFVDEDEDRWFCKSVFQFNRADYTVNQARVTVLKKAKYQEGELVLDFTHHNYIATD